MLIFNDNTVKKPLSLKDVILFAETQAVSSNIVKEYYISQIISSENALSLVCSSHCIPGESLKAATISDLTELFEYISENTELSSYKPSCVHTLPCKDYASSLKAMTDAETPEILYSLLVEHYSKFGHGDDGKYLAFVWDGSLKGVSKHDDASLSNLYCIDKQIKTLTDNTQAFLDGKPANNVLLYGNSGCGKSTSVKALLNEYSDRGLRLVQLGKEHIVSLPSLVGCLSKKPLKYIVFIDDLSFEENDGDYKPLKTALEGRVEGQANNILFYATSNRFHIINETWAQRAGDDVHASDTRNERLSLSERFGIRIHFLSPNQNDYLKMVQSILAERGVEMTDEIRAEALKWEVFYNGKSGRTANQFSRAYLSGNLDK